MTAPAQLELYWTWVVLPVSGLKTSSCPLISASPPVRVAALRVARRANPLPRGAARMVVAKRAVLKKLEKCMMATGGQDVFEVEVWCWAQMKSL